MNTWIFQGNPERFKVDEYLLENEIIWWSIRQKHLAKHIEINDEVFLWRSDGAIRGSGGVIARAKVVSLPQEYTNDVDALKYWYEDVSGKTYLAVELKVLEEDVADGINRTEFMEHEHLADLMILRLKQNTNYLLSEYHSGYLRKMWYSRIPVNPQEVHTRFPFVETLDDVIENMKRFEADLVEVEKLEKQLPMFQQWYYIHELNLLAPSKFIGYKNMKGHLYVDKDAIAWTDGRATVGVLKQWFTTCENELLRHLIKLKLSGRTRKEFSINILESEKKIIEATFSRIKHDATKAEERLIQMENGQESKDVADILPKLRPNNRVREYNFYSDEMKAQVLFEHLINNKTHRWMDINILGITEGNTNGRNSANILYYLGIKGEYRGVFQGKELSEVIQILEDSGQDFEETIRLLWLLDDAELEDYIKDDLEAERIEESYGIEGEVKYYYSRHYERSPRNRKIAIRIHGLSCFVCDFNFEKIYGERGKDFIEIHHINPLSTLEKANMIEPETDLVPLCANCHRMIHAKKNNVLTWQKLREILKQQEDGVKDCNTKNLFEN